MNLKLIAQSVERRVVFLKLPLEGKWLRSNRKGDRTRVKFYSLSRNEDLPPRSWGSCHVGTEGADCEAIGDRGILIFSLLTPNSSLQNTGGIL